MSVIPLTLIISLCLSLTFIVIFLLEYTRCRFGGDAHESLLPLADETPLSASAGHGHKAHVCTRKGEVSPRKCAACRAPNPSSVLGRHFSQFPGS